MESSNPIDTFKSSPYEEAYIGPHQQNESPLMATFPFEIFMEMVPNLNLPKVDELNAFSRLDNNIPVNYNNQYKLIDADIFCILDSLSRVNKQFFERSKYYKNPCQNEFPKGAFRLRNIIYPEGEKSDPFYMIDSEEDLFLKVNALIDKIPRDKNLCASCSFIGDSSENIKRFSIPLFVLNTNKDQNSTDDLQTIYVKFIFRETVLCSPSVIFKSKNFNYDSSINSDHHQYILKSFNEKLIQWYIHVTPNPQNITFCIDILIKNLMKNDIFEEVVENYCNIFNGPKSIEFIKNVDVLDAYKTYDELDKWSKELLKQNHIQTKSKIESFINEFSREYPSNMQEIIIKICKNHINNINTRLPFKVFPDENENIRKQLTMIQDKIISRTEHKIQLGEYNINLPTKLQTIGIIAVISAMTFKVLNNIDLFS